MDRKASEQARTQVLRFDQSDALLRKVMENAAVGMVLVGLDRRLLFVNGAFCEMLGYSRDEGLGLDVDTLFHSDDSACRLQIHRLIDGEADDYRLECRIAHKDGTAIWTLASASVLRSETSGRPLYVILQLSNIDRLRRAEEALAYTERRWNAALEAAGQGVWDFDGRTEDVYYSATWRRIRGIPQDEYVDPAQDKWLARLHPDDRARIEVLVDKQNVGEDGFDTLEYRERHRDGHYIWILSRGRPVEWDEAGKVTRAIGTDTDISRLKATEAQLAEEKERLRVTLQSIGDGVISTDAERCVTFMNPIAEEMTGWKAAEAIGEPVATVFSLIDQRSGEAVDGPISKCLASAKPVYVDTELALVGRTGAPRDIRSSAAPLRTPEGQVIGAVLVFQDVTQERALQKELAHSASHDALTGLPNRVALERVLEATADGTQAGRRDHALCFIDLDRFKQVNDGAGHAAGDALLRHVGDIIRSNCRANDFAARIGGDEFALVLAGCTPRQAVKVGRKVVAAISSLAFNWNGASFEVGASVGITSIGPDGPSALGFMGEADAACYAAKRQGRGKVVLFSEIRHTAV